MMTELSSRELSGHRRWSWMTSVAVRLRVSTVLELPSVSLFVLVRLCPIASALDTESSCHNGDGFLVPLFSIPNRFLASFCF